MKNIYYLVIIITTTFFTKGYAQTPRSNVTILFVDKSTSVFSDEQIKTKQQRAISKILSKHIQNRDDKVVISYIYGTTLDVNAEFSYLPPKQPKGQVSKLRQEKEKLKYQIRTEKYQGLFANMIYKKCFNEIKDTLGTSIFGTLRNIEMLVSKYPQSNINCYYFTDLREFSSIQKLYYEGGVSFSSYAEAINQAKNDSKKAISFYQIDTDKFSKINAVSFVLPLKPLESRAYQFLIEYWTTVFVSSLEVSNVSFQ